MLQPQFRPSIRLIYLFSMTFAASRSAVGANCKMRHRAFSEIVSKPQKLLFWLYQSPCTHHKKIVPLQSTFYAGQAFRATEGLARSRTNLTSLR